MRVSAGFLVTGLSGNTRIHTLPPRLRLRVSATRAASIWRFVTHPGSRALSPKSPKDRVDPRWALPRIRPRWVLRYFTRLGISMGRDLCLRGRLRQHFALEDPHLHADGAVCGVGRGHPKIDVGADRVERHPAVAVPLAPGDFTAAQPSRAGDTDPVGTQSEGRGHGLLHGPAERDALLELERHVLGDELGVQLGMDDLLDVEVDLLGRPLLQLVLEPLDLRPLAPDDDAGARGGDGDARAVDRALDVDARDARVVELVLDVAPDLDVLVQQARVLLGGEPPRAPGPRRAQPETDRMRLLAHAQSFSFAGVRCRGGGVRVGTLVSSVTAMVRWLVRCLMKKARPMARGCTRLSEGPPSAVARTTRRLSRSRTWWLCSALARAERRTF